MEGFSRSGAPVFSSHELSIQQECAMSYEVGKENSTEIELYYKDHGGQSGRPDPRMPIERRLMADCYYSIAVRRTDRRTLLPVTNQSDKTMFHPTNRMQP